MRMTNKLKEAISKCEVHVNDLSGAFSLPRDLSTPPSPKDVELMVSSLNDQMELRGLWEDYKSTLSELLKIVKGWEGHCITEAKR